VFTANQNVTVQEGFTLVAEIQGFSYPRYAGQISRTYYALQLMNSSVVIYMLADALDLLTIYVDNTNFMFVDRTECSYGLGSCIDSIVTTTTTTKICRCPPLDNRYTLKVNSTICEYDLPVVSNYREYQFPELMYCPYPNMLVNESSRLIPSTCQCAPAWTPQSCYFPAVCLNYVQYKWTHDGCVVNNGYIQIQSGRIVPIACDINQCWNPNVGCECPGSLSLSLSLSSSSSLSSSTSIFICEHKQADGTYNPVGVVSPTHANGGVVVSKVISKTLRIVLSFLFLTVSLLIIIL
jgi:hypothetical protein